VRAAVNRGTAEAAIIVSTVLYVEWGRLGEIGDLCVLPERRRHGLTRLLIEHRRPGPTSTGSPATAKTIGIVDDDRAPPEGQVRNRLFAGASGIRTLGPAIGTMVFSQTSLDLAGPAPSPEGMTVQSSSILIRELRARSGGLLLSSHRNIRTGAEGLARFAALRRVPPWPPLDADLASRSAARRPA
jgi:hypothetical protein